MLARQELRLQLDILESKKKPMDRAAGGAGRLTALKSMLAGTLVESFF